METKKFSISVGLPVYLEPTGNAKRIKDKLIAGKISKIGKKYFYVSSDELLWSTEAKFDKETFECWDGDNNFGYKIYLHPEWYEDEKDREAKVIKIRDMLSKHGDDLPYGVVCEVFNTLTRWSELELSEVSDK